MAKQNGRTKVDLSESSVYGGDEAAGEDVVSDGTLDRLETLTGGVEEPSPAVDDPEQVREMDELDAAIEEQIDALNLNLLRDDDLPDLEDGTGRIVDDLAEERIAMLTETEALEDPRGARSVEPGSDDTSEEIRRHHLGIAPPPVYRPNAVQRVKVKMPADVKLTGGAGVSVIWKKSAKSDIPHVTVAHKVADRDGNIEVTNFHYKFADTGYYNWDDKNKSTTFPFAGGEPSLKIYRLTQKAAAKFGITLEKPRNVVAEEAAEAAAAAAAARAAAASSAASKAARASAVDVDDEEEAFLRSKSGASSAVPAAAAASDLGAWDD